MSIQGKSRAENGKRVTVSFSDSIDLIKDQIHWTPKGVSLLTKWPFRVGAEVEFAFDHQGERHCCTGIVVACHAMEKQPGHFETVLFFVETPCSKLQKAASDCRLAPEHELENPLVAPLAGGDAKIAHRGNGVAKPAVKRISAR